MTEQQKKMIEKYKQEFSTNCQKFARYGSARDCSLNLYESNNPEDENITMVVTTITGLSEDFQTYVQTVNLMVEPDGNVINLSDVYEPSQVVTYVEQLKKID